jgi:hypothetical protein
MPEVRIADVVVPDIFAPYVQEMTEQKTALIDSGVVVRDAALDGFLAGGGTTFNAPSWRDLDDDSNILADRVSTDNPATVATPNKIQTNQEIATRLSRNQSWKTMDLVAALAGSDPSNAIANRVAAYWRRRLQAVFVSTWTGIFVDNAQVTPNDDPRPGITNNEAQNDLSVDISGGAFIAGVTDFSAEAFIDAVTTAGDSQGDFVAVFMHSIVYSKAQKNNLIDFIPDSVNQNAADIPTFLGRRVVVDDTMPNSAGVFDTWIFSSQASRWGVGNPKVPAEIERYAGQGNGGGGEELFSRIEWSMHPVGYNFLGGSVANPDGGPTNVELQDGVNNWARTFPERKQIGAARLITREF